jgi:predicted DCC family thiol-disulfide oxidoreductase YuxK
VTNAIVFYDGVCALCNGLVRFLLRRDRGARLRFAPLQGPTAARMLEAHSLDPADLDTVIVVTNPELPSARAWTGSRAVLAALDVIGGGWRSVSTFARVIPTPVADVVYRLVARTRYRVFGKFETCPLPPPEWRDRFLE